MKLPCGIEIEDELLTLRFVRASGPGGQNVNKVASAVELRFDFARSAALGEAPRERFRRLAGRRLSDAGIVVLEAQEHRSQEANRRAAIGRLDRLFAAALVAPKARRATRPTKGSQARRLQSKKVESGHKRNRGRIRVDD